MKREIEAARVIPLTRGHVAIISATDYRRVNRYKWRVTHSAGRKRANGQPYAKASVNGRDVYLHRFVMDTPDHLHCDHRNQCTLDCRRENLENVCPKINLARRRIKKKKTAINGAEILAQRQGIEP